MGWWCQKCGCEHEGTACTNPTIFTTANEPLPLTVTSDPGTYVEVGKNWAQVRLDCIKELGYALMYMDYLSPGMWHGEDIWKDQRPRVIELCHEMEDNHQARAGQENLEYWTDFYRRIIDEIENMC